MSEWKEVKLGDVVEIKGGKRLPKGRLLQKEKNDHPYIRTKDIIENKINIGELEFVPDDVYPIIKNYKVKTDDVILSIVGTVGLCAIIPSNLNDANLTENCVKLVCQTETILPRFLYLYLSNSQVQEVIQTITVGTTQPKLPLYNIRSFSFLLPPLEEQKAIAGVLSSLDDKIENLQKQNKCLELMAETLFRQWFIEEADDSWEEVKLGEVFTVSGGGTPSTSNPEFWNGDHCWTTPKDLSSGKQIFLTDSERRITTKGLSKISSGLLPIGTVLLSSRAPIGYISITAVETAINQGFIAILPNSKYSDTFIYLWCKSNLNLILGAANGSVFLEIAKGTFKQLEILTPPPFKLDQFNSQCVPLFKKIFKNEAQIQKLSELRDTLLPKLISGEVRVEL